MKVKNKLKSNSGSALMISIFAMMLLTIVIVIITSQINNQISFNKDSYDDMRAKYAAEAGIEKSIYEIVKGIDGAIDKSLESIKGEINNTTIVHKNGTKDKDVYHTPSDDCPKVKFDTNGLPVISGNDGFSYLIFTDIIQYKVNIYDNSKVWLYSNIRPILGEEIATELLKEYYEKNVYLLIAKIAASQIEDYDKLENNINTLINKIESTKREIEAEEYTEMHKITALDGLDKMIGYMNEVKCRLGMRTDEATPQPIYLDILIPYYNVRIDDDNKLDFRQVDEKKVNIEIKYGKNGNISDIDLKHLNEEYLESVCDGYKIRADIDFIFVKNNSIYEIQQKVNSYERIN